MSSSIYDATLKNIHSVNGVITRNKEIKWYDDFCMHRINFIYDKSIKFNYTFSSPTQFCKLETRNITFWNHLSNLNPSAFTGIIRGLYIVSIIFGLPVVDWLIGRLRTDQECRILIAEGNEKCVNSIKDIGHTVTPFYLEWT